MHESLHCQEVERDQRGILMGKGQAIRVIKEFVKAVNGKE